MGRMAPRTLGIIDAQGCTLLDLAAKFDAPTHIVYEILEIRPELINNVKVFDSRFPNNPCAAEIRRLALTPPKPTAPFRAFESPASYVPPVEDDVAREGPAASVHGRSTKAENNTGTADNSEQQES